MYPLKFASILRECTKWYDAQHLHNIIITLVYKYLYILNQQGKRREKMKIKACDIKLSLTL